MLGILVDFAVRLAAALVAGVAEKAWEVAPAPPPDPRRVQAAAGAYRAWAARRGFVRDDGVRGFRGKLGSHAAVVRRFSALTGPDVVEHGATRAVDAILELAMERAAPYR